MVGCYNMMDNFLSIISWKSNQLSISRYRYLPCVVHALAKNLHETDIHMISGGWQKQSVIVNFYDISFWKRKQKRKLRTKNEFQIYLLNLCC